MSMQMKSNTILKVWAKVNIIFICKTLTKCWGGYGPIRTLMYFWWECINTQPLESSLAVS